MDEAPEGYVELTLKVAVHQDDVWAVGFLRDMADEPVRVIWVEGSGDDRFEMAVLDVLTTREQDKAIEEAEEDDDDN